MNGNPWKERLRNKGVVLDENLDAKLADYLRLIREWNGYASLVSEGDVAQLETSHVPDALSLAEEVGRGCRERPWLDIGPGGGFPAVPIKLLLPEAPLVWVERSVKKTGFLRKVIGALGLQNIELVAGAFPNAVAGRSFGVVTARAVERPQQVLKHLAPFIAGGATFLCQSGDPGEAYWKMFHVELLEDDWAASGLRRGPVYRISAQ